MSTSASAEHAKSREAAELYNSMGCFERIAGVTGTSLVAGGLLGSVQASWSEASHVGVIRSTKWAMIQSTMRSIGRTSFMFGVAGGIFAAGECFSQTYRNDREVNWRNSAFGGACAGLAIGVMTRSVGGAVGSAAGLAFLSGLVAALPVEGKA